MHKYVKAGLIVGGGLLALKVWNDSKALELALKEKANTKPSNIAGAPGGHQLPTPVDNSVAVQIGDASIIMTVPNEQGLGAANPDTTYGLPYFG